MASAAAINKRSGLGAWDWQAISNTATDVLKIGQQAATTVQSFQQPSVPATYVPSSGPYAMMDPMDVPPPPSPGMSTGAKVALGVGGLALVGGIAYAVSKKKRRKKS